MNVKKNMRNNHKRVRQFVRVPVTRCPTKQSGKQSEARKVDISIWAGRVRVGSAAAASTAPEGAACCELDGGKACLMYEPGKPSAANACYGRSASAMRAAEQRRVSTAQRDVRSRLFGRSLFR